MSPRLVRLLLAAGTALQVHTILRARRVLRDSLNLDGDPDSGCGTSWCPCENFPCDLDELPPLDNTIARCAAVFLNTEGKDRCEKADGHGGLHSGGGYMWINLPGEAAA